MGGRSSSSTSQQVTNVQETTAFGDAGLITGGGKMFQAGGDLTVIDNLPEAVTDTFKMLIDLTSQTIEGAGSLATQSVSAVGQRFERAEQPETALLRFVVPAALVGLVAVVFIVTRK
jgi:hypothetical protein